MKNPTALLIVLAVVALSAGCATTSSITQTGGNPGLVSAPPNSSVPPSIKVWVLTPKVVFENTQTEEPLDAITNGGPAMIAALTDKSVSILKAKINPSVASVSTGNLSAEQKASAEQASASANQLVRKRQNSQAMNTIRSLASTNESVAVLVQYVRVKIGPSKTWNQNTGAITADASSSHFRAVMLDCRTGRCLWGNSVLLREAPDPNNKQFDKVLSLLYSTLNPQPEK